MGHSCLAFARAGLGYIYDKSEITGDNVHYAMKRASGERKTKGRSRVLPATERAASYAKSGPVIKAKSENKCVSEVRQRAHGRRERHRSVSDGKAVEEKASERGDESKTKEK